MDKLQRMNIVETKVTQTISGNTGELSGWYRIAKRPSGENDLQGIFSITTSKKGVSKIEANVLYGNVYATCTLEEDTPINGGLVAARIIYHKSYNKSHAYLEVMADANLTLNIDLLNGKGWELITPTINDKEIVNDYSVEYIQLGNDIIPKGIVDSAKTALTLANARTIALKGDVTGSVKFDGSVDVVINTTSSVSAGGSYTHPQTHPATMITEDTTHRFVTDEEKATWSDKIDAVHVAGEITKLVASAPETLNTLAKLATAINNNPKFATELIKSLEGKVDKVEGKVLSTNDYTTEDREKLAGITAQANKYEHPANHAAAMITEDNDHKFMTQVEKSKLEGIEAQANKYEHPVNHPATVITEDETHKFMTQAEKTKLGNVAENANNYTHPDSHAATMITEDTTHKFMTEEEKTKLTGIEAQANKYVHPADHLASMIKFSDGETLQQKFDNGTLGANTVPGV